MKYTVVISDKAKEQIAELFYLFQMLTEAAQKS